MRENNYELIIYMPGDKDKRSFEIANRIKFHNPRTPIVLLTPFSREVSQYLEDVDLSSIDHVFSWLGNTDLLLAIVKLVEDSIRFYSSIRYCLA